MRPRGTLYEEWDLGRGGSSDLGTRSRGGAKHPQSISQIIPIQRGRGEREGTRGWSFPAV